MCRLDITFNKNDYTNIVEEVVPFVYIPDAKELEAQAKRRQIFEYQRMKGGIIDIDVERNRYLIEIKDSMVILKILVWHLSNNMIFSIFFFCLHFTGCTLSSIWSKK